ncbi:hypothetical protein WEI85_47940 [Actinomycetes bacterium KLBMP 9797]
MHTSLRPGLNARLECVVPAERTVPYLLPESDDSADLPAVLAMEGVAGNFTTLVGRRGPDACRRWRPAR